MATVSDVAVNIHAAARLNCGQAPGSGTAGPPGNRLPAACGGPQLVLAVASTHRRLPLDDSSVGLKAFAAPTFCLHLGAPTPASSKGGVTASPTQTPARTTLTLTRVCPPTHTSFHRHARSCILTHKCTLTASHTHTPILTCTHLQQAHTVTPTHGHTHTRGNSLAHSRSHPQCPAQGPFTP